MTQNVRCEFKMLFTPKSVECIQFSNAYGISRIAWLLFTSSDTNRICFNSETWLNVMLIAEKGQCYYLEPDWFWSLKVEAIHNVVNKKYGWGEGGDGGGGVIPGVLRFFSLFVFCLPCFVLIFMVLFARVSYGNLKEWKRGGEDVMITKRKKLNKTAKNIKQELILGHLGLNKLVASNDRFASALHSKWNHFSYCPSR